MPKPFTIRQQNLPEARIDSQVMVEGHVFKPDTDLPWLAHLVLYRQTSLPRTRTMSLGRDELGALLKFVAANDPDLYGRMGVAGHRERRANEKGHLNSGEQDRGQDQEPGSG